MVNIITSITFFIEKDFYCSFTAFKLVFIDGALANRQGTYVIYCVPHKTHQIKRECWKEHFLSFFIYHILYYILKIRSLQWIQNIFGKRSLKNVPILLDLNKLLSSDWSCLLYPAHWAPVLPSFSLISPLATIYPVLLNAVIDKFELSNSPCLNKMLLTYWIFGLLF